MSLFKTILDKLGFGDSPADTPTTPGVAPAPTAAPGADTAPPAAPAASSAPVDPVAALKARPNPTNLKWDTSIVDLLKFLDIDSSLDNRKELAQELGYNGARDGSAEMNIWLHKAVMAKLAANNGNATADLKD